MFTKNSIKKSIIVGIIFLMIFGLIVPNTTAKAETYANDGVWEDDFGDDSNVTLTNCVLDEDKGLIRLNQTKAGRNYNYSEDGGHQAYSYVALHDLIIRFFSPEKHIQWEDPFSKYTGLAYMKKEHDEKYAKRSSEFFRKHVVHHFRLKLGVDSNSVGNLQVSWLGKAKAENDEQIQVQLLYWRYFTEIKRFGFWYPIGNIQSNDTLKWLNHTIMQDDAVLALSDENYLDICVVATPTTGSDCTLYTDYVNILSEDEEGYNVGYGIAETTDFIEPKNISNTSSFYWDILTWDDHEKEGATVKYHLYYENETNVSVLVPDDHFTDGTNSEGFTDSPVYLNNIPNDENEHYDKLKIMANLSTNTPSATPKLFSWAITWQNYTNQWQDLFYSDYRLDVKNKINRSNGIVSINPVSGDWPLQGQNSQNTRASEGKGASNDDLYWYNVTNADGEIINPVIKDGFLYTTNVESDTLYKYDITQPGEDDDWEINGTDANIAINEEFYASPAITEEYIIIATGEASDDGTDNYVYAFTREENPNEEWKFEYDSDICYWASPVVAGDRVFISSWSGDPTFPISNENNKLIALDLSTGDKEWEFDLPASSFSTPAAYNDVVVVACKEGQGDSLFAVDIESGEALWNKSLGTINTASPVIYKNTVFVVSKGLITTMLTAIDLDNGTTLWEFPLSNLPLATADCTPAVYNDVLYVSSPNGLVYALDVANGNEKWESPANIHNGVTGEFLRSSPAYADDLVYVGTPTGKLCTLRASNGEIKWTFETFEPHENVPVVTSPVVSNGLVFFGDENGKLYSVGEHVEPEEDIDGYIISIPIRLPDGYWWKQFFAEYQKTENSDDIVFSILDENKNHLMDIENESAIALDNGNIERTIRLRADLSTDNETIVDPRLFKWNVTFEEDNVAPVFVESSFKPNPNGWLNETTPICSIDVWDNQTGLLMSQATYSIHYEFINDSTPREKNTSAEYTGQDAENFTTLTANISKLDFSENISRLVDITFFISDLANNTNSITITFKQDTIKPTSSISNETNGSEFSTTIVQINATAEDPGVENVNKSGIEKVELYYRHSLTSVFLGGWEWFAESNQTSPSWNFTAEDGSGYYELITIATDVIGNVEDDKDEGDVTFIMDSFEPYEPDYTKNKVHWFNDTPTFSIEFEDDFKLDIIEYMPSFETEWTLIANISQRTYDDEWELEQEHWDMMEEDETYYLYFKITDSLGNIRTITNDDDALQIGKDASEPNVDLEIPDLEVEWSWDDTFTISAYADDRQGSGIKKVELYYRYSEDGTTWNDWDTYGESLTSEPFEWEFEAEEGNGYYEFKIIAEDAAGNIAESEVFSTGINIFPLYLLIGMIILIAVLIIVIAALIVKWRKK